MGKSISNKSARTTTGRSAMRGKQGRKDSKSKRINLDNERESTFIRDESKRINEPENSFAGWYDHNKELIQSAADIGFSVTTGTVTPMAGIQYVVPGVMALKWHASLGDAQAINQIKDSLYSYVVHANSRNTSYTAEDMFLFVFAGKEVFHAIADLIRAYGIMRKYDGANYYTPNALLTAMGYKASDLRANYNHMLFDINDLIAQSHQLWIPNTMPIIEREFWMNSHIYLDADNVKGQMYLYSPQWFYELSNTDVETGTALKPYRTAWDISGGRTWAQAVAVVQHLIDQLISAEYRGVIFGDLLKAFGWEKIYSLNAIDLNYEVEITYSQEVLHQMTNASLAADANVMDIVQGVNGGIAYDLASNQGLQANNTFYVGYTLPSLQALNLHVKGQPSVELITVATRMMADTPTVYSSQSKYGIHVQNTGTEIATVAVIVTYDTNGLPVATNLNSYMATEAAFPILARWSTFDWAPTVYYRTLNTATIAVGPASVNADYIFQDLDNYLPLPGSVLRRLHRACVMSLWGVPIQS